MHNLLLQVSRSDGYELNNFFALKSSTLRQLRLGQVVPNGVNVLYTYKAPYTQPFSPVTHAHTCTHAHTHPHTRSHRHTHRHIHADMHASTDTHADRQTDRHTHVDTHARAHTHTCMQTHLCVCVYCMYVCD